jgi:CheY-like chemotaxis protein
VGEQAQDAERQSQNVVNQAREELAALTQARDEQQYLHDGHDASEGKPAPTEITGVPTQEGAAQAAEQFRDRLVNALKEHRDIEKEVQKLSEQLQEAEKILTEPQKRWNVLNKKKSREEKERAQEEVGHLQGELLNAMEKQTRAELDLEVAERAIDSHVTRMVPEKKTPILDTVLLMDENLNIRDTMAAILLGAGYIVIAVETQKAAMKAIEDEGSATISLLLTDIDLSGPMDGFEVAQRLTAQYPHIRVLFVSASPEIASLVSESKVRGAGFLQRPFLGSNLLQSVQNMLVKKVA